MTSLSIKPISPSSCPWRFPFFKFLDEDLESTGAGRNLTFGTLFDTLLRRVRAENDILCPVLVVTLLSCRWKRRCRDESSRSDMTLRILDDYIYCI